MKKEIKITKENYEEYKYKALNYDIDVTVEELEKLKTKINDMFKIDKKLEKGKVLLKRNN